MNEHTKENKRKTKKIDVFRNNAKIVAMRLEIRRIVHFCAIIVVTLASYSFYYW